MRTPRLPLLARSSTACFVASLTGNSMNEGTNEFFRGVEICKRVRGEGLLVTVNLGGGHGQ